LVTKAGGGIIIACYLLPLIGLFATIGPITEIVLVKVLFDILF
jgi:hypothetical protein